MLAELGTAEVHAGLPVVEPGARFADVLGRVLGRGARSDSGSGTP